MGRSFLTSYSFENIGSVPAYNVRVRLKYPIGTKLDKIIPPIKHIESVDEKSTIFELYFHKLNVGAQVSLTVYTDNPPNSDLEFQYIEEGVIKTI